MNSGTDGRLDAVFSEALANIRGGQVLRRSGCLLPGGCVNFFPSGKRASAALVSSPNLSRRNSSVSVRFLFGELMLRVAWRSHLVISIDNQFMR